MVYILIYSAVIPPSFQEAGEIVFVPSNWHHQVHNLVSEISIWITVVSYWLR